MKKTKKWTMIYGIWNMHNLSGRNCRSAENEEINSIKRRDLPN